MFGTGKDKDDNELIEQQNQQEKESNKKQKTHLNTLKALHSLLKARRDGIQPTEE